ncbi:hypothetical protein CH75_16780 [Dyella jiangningensis]|nr:hypothetical protein CH75_16780 [Dyella jiangningensis]
MIALLRLLFAVVIAILCGWYFGLVLPQPAAWAVGVLMGALELLGPLFVNRRVTGRGFGGAVGALATLAWVAVGFLFWPGLAWGFRHVVPWISPGQAAGVAAIPAAALGFSGSGHGSGSEHLRLATVIFSVATALLALLLALPTGDRFSVAAAGFAVGVAALVARNVGIWPPGHAQTLERACVAAMAGSAVNVFLAFVNHFTA